MASETPVRPIYEIILTTMNAAGEAYHAPFGIHVGETDVIIAPYRPSRSLDNLMARREAVINFTNDARVFAGCLTGRRDFPTCPAGHIEGLRLENALAHAVVRVSRIEDDDQRPRFYCDIVARQSHAAFPGFNRAQAAVIEAAILMSRLQMLPCEKIEREIAYLSVAVEKTAGPQEREAWGWLMAHWAVFKEAEDKKEEVL